jgi:hypothetical protein
MSLNHFQRESHRFLSLEPDIFCLCPLPADLLLLDSGCGIGDFELGSQNVFPIAAVRREDNADLLALLTTNLPALSLAEAFAATGMRSI